MTDYNHAPFDDGIVSGPLEEQALDVKAPVDRTSKSILLICKKIKKARYICVSISFVRLN